MKNIIIIAISIILVSGVALFAVPQTKCPVMGGDINEKIHIDYKGERIYFCCGGCDKTFLKSPEKYLKKMKKSGIELKKINKAQSICPIMGGKINKTIYSDYKGERVYFCCSGCIAVFNKNPKKYLKKIKSDGVTIKKVK